VMTELFLSGIVVWLAGAMASLALLAPAGPPLAVLAAGQHWGVRFWFWSASAARNLQWQLRSDQPSVRQPSLLLGHPN
jgi:hypothetical protein